MSEERQQAQLGGTDVLIQLEDYSFRYRSQKLQTLKGLKLCVSRGERVLICGPSGSGKSTLGSCLNALIPFAHPGESEGRLRVCGLNPAQDGIFALSAVVGTVLQDSDSQFIGLSVGEDIAFALENRCCPQPEMRQRVQRLAELVDMGAYLKQPPKELSGGQKQRVALAGAMSLADVDILLFDEPLANLDPASGLLAMQLIDRIQRETGIALIIIEHRLEDVLSIPMDRVVLMEDGRITADAPPAELLASSVLLQAGIREPLYLSALRKSGFAIRAEEHPESLASLRLEGKKERLLRHLAPYLGEKPAAQTPEDELLSVQNLSYSYPDSQGGRAETLHDISFSIRRGEMLALVGKNGAGKSTLANLICGFLKENKGRICYEGNELRDLGIAERARNIGYVMQNPNQMLSQVKIYDELALGLRARGLGEGAIRERIERTLRVCGLYPFRNWPNAALSYGQKKRLSLASILVLEPRLLILDEPSAGQDYRHYTEFMRFLEQLKRREGLSLLLITHDMHLMLDYCDRALVLADGKLLAERKPAEVLSDAALSAAANLKLTSLYGLAERLGIPEAERSHFVQAVVSEERTRREEEER